MNQTAFGSTSYNLMKGAAASQSYTTFNHRDLNESTSGIGKAVPPQPKLSSAIKKERNTVGAASSSNLTNYQNSISHTLHSNRSK